MYGYDEGRRKRAEKFSFIWYCDVYTEADIETQPDTMVDGGVRGKY